MPNEKDRRSKRKRQIRVGLILMGLGLVSFVTLGFLAFVFFFFAGMNTLVGIVFAISFGVFLVGTFKLIKGLSIPKGGDKKAVIRELTGRIVVYFFPAPRWLTGPCSTILS